jgi:UDP-glucose 4-epimerase
MENRQMTWLITGGAGYIGAHVVSQATNSGFSVVVLDDLSTGISSRLESNILLRQFSLQDTTALHELFEEFEFEGVVHIAAKKRVGESVERPEYYWQENVVGFQNLLNVMINHRVQKLVFSSSAAVYGESDTPPDSLIVESTPCQPINPYGNTKLECEKISEAFSTENGAKVVSLRYFNVAGADRPELGDQYMFNLIPIVFDALERGEQPIVFGNDYSTPDGTCIRDYVHAQDLADAHIATMNFLENSEPEFTAINIGTGSGASVLEVLNEIQGVTGRSIHPKIGTRREGDPAALVADVSFAKTVLNWQSSRNLSDIVTSAWNAWQVGHK